MHAQTHTTYHAGPDYVDTLPASTSLTNDEIAHLSRVHASGAYDVGEDGEACTRLRGEWITVDDVEALLADVHAQDVERAADHIDARDYGARSAYVDAATGNAYVVDDTDLALLGRMLAAEVPDAYSRWCTATSATEVSAHTVAQGLAADANLVALRNEAAEADDLITMVAIDLLGETLRAILGAR